MVCDIENYGTCGLIEWDLKEVILQLVYILYKSFEKDEITIRIVKLIRILYDITDSNVVYEIVDI